MKIAVTGATGNMGREVVNELLNLDFIEELRILSYRGKKLKKFNKRFKDREEKIIKFYGSISNRKVMERLLSDVDLVINMAAIIPPASDKNPKMSLDCNEMGPKTLVEVIEKMEKKPTILHISTMALYGHRDINTSYGQVGDPLCISPFDIYALGKLRGEFTIIESNTNWVVFRQSAMLHDDMLLDNMSDGLMFHTCFNCALEWVTARDSGVLVRNFVVKHFNNELPKEFYRHVYNISGPKVNRITGYETLKNGFRILKADTKQFYLPYYNATRNFHGLFFRDGDILNNYFNYHKETCTEFWDKVIKDNKLFGLGKIVPKKLIKAFAIKPLLKDSNAPLYWYKHNDEARLMAYFGGKDKFEALPKKWDDTFKIISSNDLKDNPLNYGFDFNKKDEEITYKDLVAYANFRGGHLLSKSFKEGDLYQKLKWQSNSGEVFTASPYSVVRAGHWMNVSYKKYAWEFDKLAKTDKLLAQVWYDSHAKDEDKYYYYDENFVARMK